MTTFAQRTVPVPAPSDSASPGLSRVARSLTDAAAVLVQSLSFARAMQAAHTPAARRAVLDRFTA